MSLKPLEMDVIFTLRVPRGSTEETLREQISTSGILEKCLSWVAAMGWAPTSFEQHAEQVRLADLPYSLLRLRLRMGFAPIETLTHLWSPTGKPPAA
jgi:hypothetical protein